MMNAEELKQLYDTYFYYILLANLLVGLLLGLIPFVVAARRGRRSFGFIALIASALTGLLSPILSLIVVAVFLIILLAWGSAGSDTRSDTSE